MSRTLVLVAVLSAGCPAGGDDSDVDGAVDTTGLQIAWSTVPPTPGPVAADRTVRSLRITYSSVQLVGDAAPPSDPRTTAYNVELDWDEHGTPPPLDFLDAPPGLYSTLELGAGGGWESLRIHGDVNLGGTWIPFEIEDDQAPSISLPLAITVQPRELTVVPVEIDLTTILAAVPFAELDASEGQIELHTEDRQMAGVRVALSGAVHLGSKPEN